MKRSKITLFLVVLMACALVLSACTSTTKEPEAPTTAPANANDATTTDAPQDSAEPALEQTNKLVFYSGAATDETERLVTAFNEKYPDIEIEIVTAGTGELQSRIVAEAANPQGDVILGGSLSIYAALSDYLQSYTSPNTADYYEAFRPTSDKWSVYNINVNSIIVNKSLCEKLGVEVTGWESLLDERLKGQIAFCDPSGSASALEQVVNMLTAMTTTDSPDGGWDFIQKFVENLDGKILTSSSAVYKGVAAGEYAVGITNENKTLTYISEGYDVGVVYAKEGITLRTSNCAIIAGGPNLYNAQLFIDFCTSQEWQSVLESEYFYRPGNAKVEMTTPGVVPTDEIVALDYPSEWVEANSSTIKEKFQDIVTSIG